MPSASSGNVITSAAQIVPGVVDAAAIATDAVDSAEIKADAVGASEIAANAVGDSEIAAHTTTKITTPISLLSNPSGAQGDIMYWSGTAWVKLPASTSGMFLETLGAGANPAWAAVSGQPAWTLVQTLTWAANANDQSFTTFAAGDIFMLVLAGTDMRSIGIQVNGITSGIYNQTNLSSTALANITTNTFWRISDNSSVTTSVFTVYYLAGRIGTGTLNHTIMGAAMAGADATGANMIKGSVDGSTDLTDITLVVASFSSTFKASLYRLNL